MIPRSVVLAAALAVLSRVCAAAPVESSGGGAAALPEAGVFAPVSAGEAAHLQGLLVSLDPAVLGLPAEAVDRLKGLDRQDAAQRALLAPLNQALAGALQSGTSDGVGANAARLVAGQVSASLSAAHNPEVASAELARTVLELEKLESLVAVYKPESVAEVAEAHARARQRLAELRSGRRVEDYARQALDLLVRHGRDVRPSYERLKSLTNGYQIEALQILLDNRLSDGETYQIANKLDAILVFDNPHQVEALRALTDNGRQVNPSLDAVARIDNAYQAEAVRILASHGDYQVSDKMGQVLRFSNPYQVEGLRLLVADGRRIRPSLPAVAQLSNVHQVEALLVLLKGSDGSVKYRISDKMPTVLRIGNPHQVSALSELASHGLPVKPFLKALEGVRSPEQVAPFLEVAALLKAPGLAKRYFEGALIGFALPFVLMLHLMWTQPSLLTGILATVAGGAVAVAYLADRLRVRRVRRANRAELDAHPEIEKALGAVDDSLAAPPRLPVKSPE